MSKPSRIAADHLKSLIERIERMEEEKAGIAADIRDIYSEAKGVGFDAKVMRKVIALRKQDAADRDEQDAILATYLFALGMAPAPSHHVEIDDGAAEEAVDKRAVRAIELLRDGMSIRKVAGETGMGHGTVQRLSKALARRQIGEVGGAVPAEAVPQEAGTPAVGTPTHDPDTGEIAEPTVSVSVKRNGETLADSGPMPMSALKAVGEAMMDAGPIPRFLDRRVTA
jgi:uncharacterized protein (UPF0335 family)